MYAVLCDGEWQAEFKTLAEAKEYIKKDIRGMATTYNKTIKWVKDHFTWEIIIK